MKGLITSNRIMNLFFNFYRLSKLEAPTSLRDGMTPA